MKRRIRQNVFGNWVAYAGNKKVITIGEWEVDAKDWMDNKCCSCGVDKGLNRDESLYCTPCLSHIPKLK